MLLLGESFVLDSNSLGVFAGCKNLTVSAPPNEQPVFLNGTILEGMFANSSFNSALAWNLSGVVNIKSMWKCYIGLASRKCARSAMEPFVRPNKNLR